MKKNSKKNFQPSSTKEHNKDTVIVKKEGKKITVTIIGISAIKIVCIAFIIFILISLTSL